MLLPLFDHWPRIQQRVARAAHLLVLLDYDGTLTPIVDHPAQAQLAPETRQVLVGLAGRPATSVAVISGRSLGDVRDRVALPGLVYAGNHGMEIQGPAFHYLNPIATACRDHLREIADILQEGLREVPGAWVENKRLTVSVHIRHVSARDQDKVREVLMWSLVDFAPHLELTGGIQVFEVRPKVAWHKGAAALWIREQLNIPVALTLYLGDDLTDEDAFRSLTEGVNVRVGYVAESAASYFLPSSLEVKDFLQKLADLDH